MSTDMINFDISSPYERILVPPLRPTATPLPASQLKGFLRNFNKSRSNRKMSVKICCRDKPPTRFKDPITVRMVLEDVLVAYITLGLDEQSEDAPLLIEFVNVLGSREAKPLHTPSDYLVFQQITQYMTGVIRNNPEVSLQSILRILESYRDLFFSRCATCDRVASEDDHSPPIARLWKSIDPSVPAYEMPIEGVQHGELLPSHLACVQS